MSAKMPKAKRDLIKAVRGEFERVKRDLWQQMLADSRYPTDEIRHIQIAQNTLRLCMEATIEKMMPFSLITPPELAIRLASYALSIAPMEDQDACMAIFMQNFILAHEKRMHNGIRIKSGWRDDGGPEYDNFPGDAAPKKETG